MRQLTVLLMVIAVMIGMTATVAAQAAGTPTLAEEIPTPKGVAQPQVQPQPQLALRAPTVAMFAVPYDPYAGRGLFRGLFRPWRSPRDLLIVSPAGSTVRVVPLVPVVRVVPAVIVQPTYLLPSPGYYRLR
jgi:hypothetical protein